MLGSAAALGALPGRLAAPRHSGQCPAVARAAGLAVASCLAAAAAAAAARAGCGGNGLAWGLLRRQARVDAAVGSIESGHFGQLPLPLALLAGVSLVLLWEVIHPRTSLERSSIARQAADWRFVFGGRGRKMARAPVPQAAAAPRLPAAAVLKSKMGEFSYLAPRHHCLTRASSGPMPPGIHGAAPSLPVPLPVLGSPTVGAAAAAMEAEALAEWLAAEEGTGPLASRPAARGSVVFFTDHTVAVESGRTEVTLTLFRVGSLSHELSVAWSTMDGTAMAGMDYEAAKGVSLFIAGAKTSQLTVRLLEADHSCCTQKFFVVHVEAISGRGTMGSLPFARVRVLHTGPWPPGLPLEQQPDHMLPASWAYRRAARHLVRSFIGMLVRWRGRKYWKVLLALFWKGLHQVVLNTLLLNFALYDFCFARAGEPAAYRRLPTIVGLKLLLVLLDRFADHVAATTKGTKSCTQLVQMQLLHKYLEMRHDPMELGRFCHLFFDTAPDSIAYAYSPTFQLLHSLLTLALSLLMALAVPMLRGHPVSLKTLQPLFGIVVLVPLAFLLALSARRSAFEALVQQRRDAHAEACDALQEVLACRHGVRAFDGAYPAQQVRLACDAAHRGFLGRHSAYWEFKSDTQWVARYLGELAKLLIVLYSGYAALNHARTGVGTMTLGQFAVVMSLYSAIISALYDFIEAWVGFSYARILISELSNFFNRPSPWLRTASARSGKAGKEPVTSQGVRDAWPSICVVAVDVDIDFEEGSFQPKHFARPSSPSEPRGASVEIPLGCIYAVTASDGWSGARRYVGALLGGACAPRQGDVATPSFVRTLLVAPPASLAAGSVLENLTSYAAAWVRGSDALALAAVLGMPFEAPAGAAALHKLLPGRLLEALNSTLADWELPAPTPGSPPLLHLPTAEQADEDLLARVGASFRVRMAAMGVTVLSPMSKVEPLLRPAEMQVLDLVRGILADPDVLVVQDTLSALPMGHARAVLQVLKAWQRLGGLKGVAGAWERTQQPKAQQAGSPGALEPQEAYPAWLTKAGGLCRTVVLSESTLVTAGLTLESHVDACLVVGCGSLEVVAAGT